MAQLHELAILANKLGGIKELAYELGISEALLRKALAGTELTQDELNALALAENTSISDLRKLLYEPLTRREQAQIDEAYARFQQDEEKLDDLEIDYDELEPYFKGAKVSESMLSGDEFKPILRESIAEGRLDLDLFDSELSQEFYRVFDDLTYGQLDTLFNDYVVHNNENFSDLFRDYLEDFYSGAWFENTTENSLFWAWFREVFYS